jgi:hypothetical protein
MQKALKGLYMDIQMFLPPKLFTEKGGRRLELEVAAIAANQTAKVSRVTQVLVKLVELWSLTSTGKYWLNLAMTYKIPTPMILEGLHKTVVEKVKGKDHVRTKKPKRPSKRIEVLSRLESELLRRYETPFDEYKTKMKSLGNEIDIKDVKEVRQKLKDLINSMWIVVEKFSAPLTKRRTAMCAHLTENDRKKLNFNKAYVDKLRSEQFSTVTMGDKANMYTLSPIPIFLKCQETKYVVSANKISMDITYILVPKECDQDVRDIVYDYARIIGVRPTDTLPEIRRKKRHGPSKTNWKDQADYDEFLHDPEEQDLEGAYPTEEKKD